MVLSSGLRRVTATPYLRGVSVIRACSLMPQEDTFLLVYLLREAYRQALYPRAWKVPAREKHKARGQLRAMRCDIVDALLSRVR